jgi:hypothetical protein
VACRSSPVAPVCLPPFRRSGCAWQPHGHCGVSLLGPVGYLRALAPVLGEYSH